MQNNSEWQRAGDSKGYLKKNIFSFETLQKMVTKFAQLKKKNET